MGSENANLEDRLKSLISQLQTEASILDRIIYKGKNQHRRCLYFQYLLKVRRDVRLLLSAGLKEILSFLFQLINGKKPTLKLHLLERLKRTNHNGKHNFQERLLGVARLLSQMVEPILKAAIHISSLLARSFFMGFSLTVFALLARLRVLVQQVLLDVVLVFNMVSSLSQKEQYVKLTMEGIEVFEEYHPPNGEVVTLECVWERDKFVLLEKTYTPKMKNGDGEIRDGSDVPLGASTVRYHSIEISNEDPCVIAGFQSEMNPESHLNGEVLGSAADIKGRTTNIRDDIEVDSCAGASVVNAMRAPKKETTAEESTVSSICPFSSHKAPKAQSQLKNNAVAFVSVRKSLPSEINECSPRKKLKADWLSGSGNETEDPFFSLLTAGNVKSSLF